MGKKYRIVSIRRRKSTPQRMSVWLLKKVFGPAVGGVLGFLLPVFIAVIAIVSVFMVVAGSDDQKNEIEQGQGRGVTTNISVYTQQYANALLVECNSQGIPEYYQVLLAMMDMESGGEPPEEWPDRMCSSECGLYTPDNPDDDQPGAIQDPYVSIRIGVQYFKQKVENYALLSETGRVIDDYNLLCAIVQSYNFGDGFIYWLEDNYNMRFSMAAAREYSEYMADQLGWTGYGDWVYIQKFESRYDYYGVPSGDLGGFGGIGAGTFIWPVNEPYGPNSITSSYGTRDFRGEIENHGGIDIGVPMETPVYATADGIVEYTQTWDGTLSGMMSYGSLVILKHNNGFRSYYAHLSYSNIVREGEEVKQGQLIGYSGTTGDSTGPHLHFEMRRGEDRSTRFNPLDVIVH